MTKQHFIIGLVAAAAVGIGAFLYFAPVSREIGQPDPEPTIETSGKKIPFADFMKQSGSYTCTVQQHINDTEAKGVVHLDNGRLAGEFAIKAGNMDMTAHFILRDGYSYSWSSMAPSMGFKVKTVAVNGEGNAEARAQLAFNAQSIGDYDCQPWTADESVFAVPTSVQFREM